MSRLDYSTATHCASKYRHDLRLPGAVEFANGTSRRCVECRRIKDRNRAKRPYVPPTHCPHGHEYTAKNCVVVPRSNGRDQRHCLACKAARKSGADRSAWRVPESNEVALQCHTREILDLMVARENAGTPWGRAEINLKLAELQNRTLARQGRAVRALSSTPT